MMINIAQFNTERLYLASQLIGHAIESMGTKQKYSTNKLKVDSIKIGTDNKITATYYDEEKLYMLIFGNTRKNDDEFEVFVKNITSGHKGFFYPVSLVIENFFSDYSMELNQKSNHVPKEFFKPGNINDLNNKSNKESFALAVISIVISCIESYAGNELLLTPEQIVEKKFNSDVDYYLVTREIIMKSDFNNKQNKSTQGKNKMIIKNRYDNTAAIIFDSNLKNLLKGLIGITNNKYRIHGNE